MPQTTILNSQTKDSFILQDIAGKDTLTRIQKNVEKNVSTPKNKEVHPNDSGSKNIQPVHQKKTDIALKTDSSFIDSSQLVSIEKIQQGPVIISAENQVSPTNHSSTTIVPKDELIVKKEFGFSNDWVIILFSFSFLSFVLLRILFGKYLLSLQNMTFNYNISLKFFENGNLVQRRAFSFLNLIFYLNGGIFLTQCYLLFIDANLPYKPFYISLAVSLILMLLYLLKETIVSITGFIFKSREACSEYLFNVFLINKSIGILLFPFIISIPFLPFEVGKLLTIIAFILIASLVVLRLIRSMELIIRKNVSPIYSLIFTVILEIIPGLIAFKESINHI